MHMFRFDTLFPTIAARETCTIRTAGGRVPDDLYGYMELFCIDPACDCRCVQLQVIAASNGEQLATIHHAFDARPRVGGLGVQTFLDDMNTQSRHSGVLLELFHTVLLADPAYVPQLISHYETFKAALQDATHPAFRQLATALARESERETEEEEASPAFGGGCGCGSRRVYYRCCGTPMMQ